MDKQKKHTILNVIIIISVIALMLIICSVVYEYIVTERDTNQVYTNNETINSIGNETEKGQDELTENNETDNEYVGEEEKETEIEKEEKKSDDEKALDLAKKEWGEDSSVQFSIEEKKGNKYYIAVTSNATRIAWYEVNTDTWEISEFY